MSRMSPTATGTGFRHCHAAIVDRNGRHLPVRRARSVGCRLRRRGLQDSEPHLRGDRAALSGIGDRGLAGCRSAVGTCRRRHRAGYRVCLLRRPPVRGRRRQADRGHCPVGGPGSCGAFCAGHRRRRRCSGNCDPAGNKNRTFYGRSAYINHVCLVGPKVLGPCAVSIRIASACHRNIDLGRPDEYVCRTFIGRAFVDGQAAEWRAAVRDGYGECRDWWRRNGGRQEGGAVEASGPVWRCNRMRRTGRGLQIVNHGGCIVEREAGRAGIGAQSRS